MLHSWMSVPALAIVIGALAAVAAAHLGAVGLVHDAHPRLRGDRDPDHAPDPAAQPGPDHALARRSGRSGGRARAPPCQRARGLRGDHRALVPRRAHRRILLGRAGGADRHGHGASLPELGLVRDLRHADGGHRLRVHGRLADRLPGQEPECAGAGGARHRDRGSAGAGLAGAHHPAARQAAGDDLAGHARPRDLQRAAGPEPHRQRARGVHRALAAGAAGRVARRPGRRRHGGARVRGWRRCRCRSPCGSRRCPPWSAPASSTRCSSHTCAKSSLPGSERGDSASLPSSEVFAWRVLGERDVAVALSSGSGLRGDSS